MFQPNCRMRGKETLLRRLEANDANTTIATFDTFPMSPDDVNRLARSIQVNTHLLALKLLDCQLRPIDVVSLCSAIKENSSLEEVAVEVFANYPTEIKESIQQMQHHLRENIAQKHLGKNANSHN